MFASGGASGHALPFLAARRRHERRRTGRVGFSASLKGEAKPQFGQLLNATGCVATADTKAVSLNGRDGCSSTPAENFGADFTVAVRVRVASCRRETDPAKSSAPGAAASTILCGLTVDGGKLAAASSRPQLRHRRCRSRQGEWHHVAAVKAGAN